MRFGRPDQIIETLITQVRAIQPMRDQNLEKLIHFSNHVRNLVETIKSLKCTGHLKNPQLLKELLGKIPDMLKLQWGDIMYNCGGEADLNSFSEWLNTRANAACYVSTPSSKYKVLENFQHYSRFQTKPRHEVALSTNERKHPKILCHYCEMKGHKTQLCPKFNENDVETRWSVVTKKKLCFSCLSNNHQTYRCEIRKSCGLNGCRRHHHKLLHKDSFEMSNSNYNNDTKPCTENSASISKDASDPNTERVTTTRHDMTTKVLLRVVNTITRGDWMKYDYLQGLPFQNITSRPMILLGQDNINLTVARKVCQGPENTPIATKTHLGWILHGPTDFGKTFSQFSFHICLREQADEKLHDLVKQTFSLESFGISNNHKNPDKSVDRAINIVNCRIRKTYSGKVMT
ncbi:hypothetical protein JTB14_000345 [Gonioctena quinquepunctata]|nr:hypothetical protein JTB14_000345 [Gonioctena quinquepunctata]